MPVCFDVIALVNKVLPASGDEQLENNPIENDDENPLLRLDSIALQQDEESEIRVSKPKLYCSESSS